METVVVNNIKFTSLLHSVLHNMCCSHACVCHMLSLIKKWISQAETTGQVRNFFMETVVVNKIKFTSLLHSVLQNMCCSHACVCHMLSLIKKWMTEDLSFFTQEVRRLWFNAAKNSF